MDEADFLYAYILVEVNQSLLTHDCKQNLIGVSNRTLSIWSKTKISWGKLLKTHKNC